MKWSKTTKNEHTGYSINFSEPLYLFFNIDTKLLRIIFYIHWNEMKWNNNTQKMDEQKKSLIILAVKLL